MNTFDLKISRFGEMAMLLEWPQEVNELILADILAFVEALKAQDRPEWEYVPSYNSVTLITKSKFDFEQEKAFLLNVYSKRDGRQNTAKRHCWQLPVCYDSEFALDLPFVSEKTGLSEEEIIKLHTSEDYLVYGIGFLPGFLYLGGLPPSLEIPRLENPRLEVSPGAVGLAGKQTGIYPQNSPGGWNIIGNCPIPLFNPKLEPPCFVKVGDRIRFHAITKAEHKLRQIESEVGIYNLNKTLIDA
ncbi:MAG: 5-oxoprolinase subunit PxpB [Bacteroidota bacterium]